MAFGLMDQAPEALGVDGIAILLDCRTLARPPVPLPLDRCAIILCAPARHGAWGRPGTTRAARSARRRSRSLATSDPSIHALRDVTPGMPESTRSRLDDETYRRCEHVAPEEERVLQTVAALETGDLAAVGRCLTESHARLRDLPTGGPVRAGWSDSTASQSRFSA